MELLTLFYLNRDGGYVILRENDLLLKKLFIDSLLTPSWGVHTWILTLCQNSLTIARCVAFVRIIPTIVNSRTKIHSKICDENKEVQHEPKVVLFVQSITLYQIRQYLEHYKTFTQVIFKENVRCPIWTCRDPISLILGTWFSLILGTRWWFLWF